MKCPECGNKFWVKNSNALTKGGLWARRYQCKSCGYKLETVEVSKKEYIRQHKLVVDLKIAISQYVNDKKAGGR